MIKKFLIFFLLINPNFSYSAESENFEIWLKKFKIKAIESGISKKTITNSFKNIKYLEKVIEYDRRQPEFYEDTLTYV